MKSTLHVWERPNLRNPDKVKLKEKKDNNPYKTAFVIKNPMLAYEKKKVGEYKPDPLWKKLTSGEKYSLYNASKPWTLVIMELQGAAVVDQSFAGAFLEKIGFSDGSKKLLNANAKQASEVARLLRHYGMKAFVLHTRASSIVTVGEFDSPKSRELIQMQQQLANFRLRGSQVALPLFARPQPMRVPR